MQNTISFPCTDPTTELQKNIQCTMHHHKGVNAAAVCVYSFILQCHTDLMTIAVCVCIVSWLVDSGHSCEKRPVPFE